jgi:hypothetical protein
MNIFTNDALSNCCGLGMFSPPTNDDNKNMRTNKENAEQKRRDFEENSEQTRVNDISATEFNDTRNQISELTEAKNNLNDAQTRISKLDGELTEAKNNLDDAQTCFAELEGLLRIQISELTEAKNKHTTDLNDAQTRKHTTDLNNAQTRISELVGELTETKNNLNDAQTRISKLAGIGLVVVFIFFIMFMIYLWYICFQYKVPDNFNLSNVNWVNQSIGSYMNPTDEDNFNLYNVNWVNQSNLSSNHRENKAINDIGSYMNLTDEDNFNLSNVNLVNQCNCSSTHCENKASDGIRYYMNPI